MKIDGGCHCGHVTYEAEVDPARVYACHCTDCQAISGGAFRWAVTIPREDFRLLSGAPKTYEKVAESGAASRQLFCPHCASPLYSSASGDDHATLNVRLVTARQRAQLPPREEVWCRSAQDWVELRGPAERLETQ